MEKIEKVSDKMEHITDIFEIGFENVKERLDSSEKNSDAKFEYIKEIQKEKFEKIEESVNRFIEDSQEIVDNSLKKYTDDIHDITNKVNDHDLKLTGSTKDKTAFWTLVVSGIVAIITALIGILPSLLGR